MGPHDPSRRSQSPMRSAMHRPENANESPSMQLQTEQDQADQSLTQVMSPNRRHHPTSVSSDATDGRRQSRPGGTNGVTKTRARPQHRSSTQSSTRSDRETRRQTPHEQIPIVEELLEDMPEHVNPAQPEGTHENVCTRLNDLKSRIREFAEAFPAPRNEDDVLSSLLVPENRCLVRYIGCLAMGGKSGVQGWQNLLRDETCRHALVFGIIGQALKENVFAELCFGADGQLKKLLKELEEERIEHDGFVRTRERADEISRAMQKHPTTQSLNKAIAQAVLQLETLLLPLWKPGATVKSWTTLDKRGELVTIVKAAGQLSQRMHSDRDTVYYWPPTYKDEEFEADRMECYNLYDMIQHSPYDRKTVNGHDRAVLREGHELEREAIVRVVCFPGLFAYTQGGGDLAKRELGDDTSRDPKASDAKTHRKMRTEDPTSKQLTGHEGFRTKLLSKSVVLLQWGKQRLLTKEAGTGLHIDAMKAGSKKYEQDYEGFVELYDLFGRKMARAEAIETFGRSGFTDMSWLSNVSSFFSQAPAEDG